MGLSRRDPADLRRCTTVSNSSIGRWFGELATRARTSRLIAVVDETYDSWRADRTIRLGAGLAYYALFGVVPFLALSIAIAGFAFSQEEVRSTVAQVLEGVLGVEETALMAEAASGQLAEAGMGSSLGLVGIGALVFSASLLLAAFQDALNVIFGVPVQVGIRRTLRRRLFLFLLVLVFASAVLLSLILGTVIAWIADLLNLEAVSAPLLTVIGRIVSLGAVGGALAVMYRLLPRVEVPWRAATIGGAAVAVTGWLATKAVGAYLERFGTSSVEGAAGGLVLLLTLVYVLSQVALAGAQLTKTLVASSVRGSEPTSD